MRLLKKISSFIKLNDIFYSSELLRYENQNQFQTVTGGVLSIGIWITVIISFASMVLETFDKSNITSQQIFLKHDNPSKMVMKTQKGSNFMFGIRITDLNTKFLDLNAEKRYFDIYFAKLLFSGGKMKSTKLVPLEKCTRDHWVDFPNILQSYDKLLIDYWLCPPKNASFDLQGLQNSDISSSVAFQISSCRNQTNINNVCASPQQIQDLLKNKTNFSVKIFFTNPVINPNQKEYITYYLQENGYAIFSKTIGSQMKIFLADYSISSDNSYWPFESVSQDTGAILDGTIINRALTIDQNNPVYALISIVKSATSIKINRQVQKISSVFSYIGGFYGAIIAGLFIIKAYTDSAFEFSLASNLFEGWTKNSSREKEESFHLFTFLGIKICTIMQKLGIKNNWQRMNRIIEGQQEIQNHLDIVRLLRRIISLEDCFTYVLKDFEIQGIKMQRNKTLTYVKQLRNKFIKDQLQNDNQNNLNSEIKIINENPMRQPITDEIRNLAYLNELNTGQSLMLKKQTNFSSILNNDSLREREESQSIEVIKLQKPNLDSFGSQNKSSLSINEEDRKNYILQRIKKSSQKDAISQRVWEKINKTQKEMTIRKSN